MKIKMLALDMDDTLLKKDLSISLRNKEVLRKAEEQGVIIVLATGRADYGVKRYIDELKMNEREGYAICFNGASIIRTDTKEEVFGHRLPAALSRKVCKIVENLEMPLQYYRGDTIFVSKDNLYTDKDCFLSGMKKEVVPDFMNSLQDEVIKLIIPGEPKRIQQVFEVLQNQFGEEANILTSKPYFLEVLPKKADKKTALEYLSEVLSIHQESIMAVGDAMNDMGMVEYAGVGVAMKNAEKKLQEMANIISRFSHEEDGIADIVERYILCR